MLLHIHSLFYSPSFAAEVCTDRSLNFHATFLHFPSHDSHVFRRYSNFCIFKFQNFVDSLHISRKLHCKRHLSRDTFQLRVKYVGEKPRKFSRVAHKSFSLHHRPTLTHSPPHATLPHASTSWRFHHQRASKYEFTKLFHIVLSSAAHENGDVSNILTASAGS